MSWLLKNQHIIDCRNLDVDKVIDKLKSIKYKNTFSKHKNAFFKFCAFIDLPLSPDVINTIESLNDDKTKKYRKLKPVMLKDMLEQIEAIKDKKLKISFQTILETGFRVSEISQIKKEDCVINMDCLEFRFIGKGGENESVRVVKSNNPNLYNALINHINTLNDKNKVFYSASYLQAEATKRDFKCHNLRRAFAKQNYREYRSIDKVQELLRHAKRQTTLIYLKSKVEI